MDLRKALGLLVRSNAAALEWLSSPIVHRRDEYRRDEEIAAELAGLARVAAHRPALEYHYDRLARGAWPPTRFKALFYALRPALALTWLRRVGTPPPMDVPSLVADLAPPPGLMEAIAALQAHKAARTGADPALPCPEVEAFVTAAPGV